jgi:pilus assembly protein CpaB
MALALAFIASAGCTWLASRKLMARPQHSAAPTVVYVAPSRELQAGEILTPANTGLLAWPGAMPIDGAFARLADVNGRAVLYPLTKGQPILDRDLAALGSGIGLATRIPNGMRAVALRSDEVVSVAGFLLPGSHVDVLVTYRSGQSPEPLTATVLENAVVLATGHQVEPDPDGKTSDTTVVTLLLSPEQSQLAVLAAAQGAIHFILRNAGDVGRSGDTPALVSQLAGSLPVATRPVLRPTSPAPPVVPKHPTIEVIQGAGL